MRSVAKTASIVVCVALLALVSALIWYASNSYHCDEKALAAMADADGEVDGVVLLAAYPNQDLSQFPGKALTVYGTSDGVLNKDSYEQAKSKLPANAAEVVLAGANHANFGNYGSQEGDGEADITREEQQEQTAQAIARLVKAA